MASEQPDYFPALDGLRFICCLFVIAGHGMVGHTLAPQFGQLGPMGVNVFFALSGFLITTLLLRERAKRGAISLKKFYLRRVLRIFPVYYAAVGAALLGVLVLGDRYLKPFGSSREALDLPLVFGSHALFLANWVSTALPTTLDVLWSVSIEEQFYLVFPAALVLTRNARGAVFAVVALLAVCWATRGVLVTSAPELVYRNTLAHGDHLLLGALTAIALHAAPVRTSAVLQKLARAQLDSVLLVSIAVLAFVETLFPNRGVWLFFDYLGSAMLCALLVGVVSTNQSALCKALALPRLRFLGQLTYAGYVFHMYCVAVAWFVMARVTTNVQLAAPLRTLMAVPLTFGVAWVSRVVLEQRALKLKERFNA
jgi:peptidoglycan/LPS O-acetylase OafA/YrhL